ncbi:serine/threonine protein kinase [Planktothrix pseudagardhii]|nr:protein kinase [Planktothrix pseudagardhii]
MNLTQEIVLQNGKYRIDAVLGQGEFGVTYQAMHPLTHQTVVIKTLHPKFITSVDFPQIKQQFATVAKRLSQCQHPNIARVLDIFEEKGLPYLVMNYIAGQTLEETLRAHSPLSVHQALQYIRQISSAMRTLHQHGLLHCNLQPRNILRHQGTDILTLVDFGLTSGFIEPSVKFPIRNRVLSVGYASLEHYLPHQHLTPATDIYSLAATFYCLLTGEPPLEAPLRVNEATQQLLSASKPTLRQIQPTLSPVVERLIYWGLEIEPSRRPQSVDQWIAFLPIEDIATTIQSPNTVIQPQNSSVVELVPPKSVAVKAVVETPVSVQEKPLTSVATLPSFPLNSPPPQIQPVPVAIPTWEPEETIPSLGFLLPILFLITSLFFGWVGFDLTRRYGYIISQKTNIQLNHPFNNLDSTEPMFENPSVETQNPKEVAAERSTEQPLEEGYDSTVEPSDAEAKTEETSPVEQSSDTSIATEIEGKSSSTSESQLEEYLLSPPEQSSSPEVGLEPNVTDSSASAPVTNYSGDNDSTISPSTEPESNYSQDGNGTLPTETTPGGGGGLLPEEPVPNSYSEPTVPVEPQYPVSSEETTPMTSTPNYGTESNIPTSPLTSPISN